MFGGSKVRAAERQAERLVQQGKQVNLNEFKSAQEREAAQAAAERAKKAAADRAKPR